MAVPGTVHVEKDVCIEKAELLKGRIVCFHFPLKQTTALYAETFLTEKCAGSF